MSKQNQWIVGVNAVASSIENDADHVREVLVEAGSKNPRLTEIEENARRKGIDVRRVSAQALDGVGGAVRHQGVAQRGELPVRIPVERGRGLRRGGGDVGDAGRRGAVGILVDVELHGHVELRRPVGLDAGELGADRGEAHSNRTLTAAPWPGRSSAAASVVTWSFTPSSPSRL